MHRTCFQIVLGVAAALFLAAAVPAHPGSGILVDRLGQVYFIDTGSGLWKIDTRGALTHLSPLRNHWLAIDPNDKFTQPHLPTDPGRDWVITAAGSNPTILISTDFPMVIGLDGNLYYPTVRETNARILRSDIAGKTSVVATLPRTAGGAAVSWINGISTGPDGSIYYTEDAAIKRITAQGKISTAAIVTALVKGPAVPETDKHPYLRGLKVDLNGVLYVADNGDARVLRITPDGKVTTLVQLESPWSPTDVAIFGDIVYVLEYLHTPGDDRVTWMPRVRKITPDGRSNVIVTVDQMPGARPAKTAGSEPYNFFSAELLDLILRSIFRLA